MDSLTRGRLFCRFSPGARGIRGAGRVRDRGDICHESVQEKGPEILRVRRAWERLGQELPATLCGRHVNRDPGFAMRAGMKPKAFEYAAGRGVGLVIIEAVDDLNNSPVHLFLRMASEQPWPIGALSEAVAQSLPAHVLPSIAHVASSSGTSRHRSGRKPRTPTASATHQRDRTLAHSCWRPTPLRAALGALLLPFPHL